MTLAQRLGQSLSGGADVPAPSATADSRSIQESTPADLRQIAMRRLPALASIQAAAAQPERRQSLDAALALVSEARQALADLLEAYQHLEYTLEATDAQTRSDLASAHEYALEWRKYGESFVLQNDQLGKQIALHKNRADIAEHASAAAKSSLEKTQEAATQAECLAASFRDKVQSYFGIGSNGSSLIERASQLTKRT